MSGKNRLVGIGGVGALGGSGSSRVGLPSTGKASLHTVDSMYPVNILPREHDPRGSVQSDCVYGALTSVRATGSHEKGLGRVPSRSSLGIWNITSPSYMPDRPFDRTVGAQVIRCDESSNSVLSGVRVPLVRGSPEPQFILTEYSLGRPS
jgi:hypothetical protein